MLSHNDLQVNHTEIHLPRLPKAWHNLKIAQLSDLHFYEHTDRGYYDRVIEEANALEADIIAVTGDIIHYGDRYIGLAGEYLTQLNAKKTKLAILGNHDYYDFANGEHVKAMLKESGFTVLVNESVVLEHENVEEKPLVFAGLDDWWKGQPDLNKTLEDQNNVDCPVIMLAHNPLLFDPVSEYKKLNVDLQLSGHTHAGHVYIPFLELIHRHIFHNKYRYGLFQKNNTKLYVTSGVGSAAFYIKSFGLQIGLPRFRFNTNPEVACITLLSESK